MPQAPVSASARSSTIGDGCVGVSAFSNGVLFPNASFTPQGLVDAMVQWKETGNRFAGGSAQVDVRFVRNFHRLSRQPIRTDPVAYGEDVLNIWRDGDFGGFWKAYPVSMACTLWGRLSNTGYGRGEMGWRGTAYLVGGCTVPLWLVDAPEGAFVTMEAPELV